MMRQSLPRNVLTRLESSRVVVYGLLAGALVGVLGTGLRLALDRLGDGLALLTHFRPPGTPGEGGLLIAFGDAALPGLVALPLLATLSALLRPAGQAGPLEEAVRAYHAPRWEGQLGRQGLGLLASVLAYLSLLVVGRDGPFTALGNLSAGLLARLARLSAGQARTLGLSCVGASLGLVLHAPLAAAVLMVEVLYRRFEFEFEVLLPAVLASVAAYAVYGATLGFSPLVTPAIGQPPELAQLPLYALLAAAICAAAWTAAQLRSLLPALPAGRAQPWLRGGAALAFGLISAGVAWAVPETLGDGSGWFQVALNGFGSAQSLWQGLIRLGLLLGVAWLGLGGTVLGSVSVGGLLGVGAANLWPAAGLDPAVAGMVGAAAFLTTSHNVPVAATLLLAAWGGDALLPPLLVGTLLAHALSGEVSLVEGQVRSHALSPVHAAPGAEPAPGSGPPDEAPGHELAAAPGEQLFRVPLPPPWVGVHGADVAWPLGVQYVAVMRRGEVQLAEAVPVFEDGDELVLLATPGRLEGFAEMLSPARAAEASSGQAG